MKKLFKRISSLLLAVLLLLSTCTTAFAADSIVTYKGRKSGFEFSANSVYTGSDLFDEFKNVMPGDVREEVVTIKNEYTGSDYIKVWMRALLHDENGNPISPDVLEALQARKASSSDANMSDYAYMNKFLSQFTLKIWNGEKADKNLIYSGHPSSLAEGFEDGNVYLGSIRKKNSKTLNVQLSVDIEMGNEFADHIGEVDWVFVIEERNDPSGDGGSSGSKPSKPSGEGPRAEIIEDGYHLNVLPKTGDDMVVFPYIILGGLSLFGMIILIVGRRKENE